MPITIGPQIEPFPKPVYPPLVQVRRLWSDDWVTVPQLELVEATRVTAGAGIDSATIRHRYGALFHPWEADFSNHTSWALEDWWVRILLPGTQGLSNQWVGRVSGEGRQLFGNSPVRAGDQQYQAYGPGQLLHKTSISTSYWSVGGEEKQCQWVPGVNVRGGRDRGNRSDAKLGDTYLHAGDASADSEWTYHEYLAYVLAKFVDASDDDGPVWTIGGQDEFLKELTQPIPLSGATITAAELVRRLIPLELGLDYRIVTTADGFEIEVFALSAEEQSWGDVTMPRNPQTVRVRAGSTHDNIQTHLVATGDHRYGRIRVLGERIVVCTTLCGLWADHPYSDSLDKKWTAAQETEYKDPGATADNPTLVAEARAQPKLADVYSKFGAPADWDFHGGAAAPKLDDEGRIVADESADYQQGERGTLSWIPLLAGFDYTADPAVDNVPEGVTDPEYLAPIVWVTDYDSDDDRDPSEQGYWSCDDKGIGVHVLEHDLGIRLTCRPQHLLAREHFSGGKPGEDHEEPLYDWDRIVATIAFESDQRLQLVAQIADHDPTDGTLDLYVPDAHYWYLAPNTVVAVDNEAAAPLRTSGATGRTLRDDSAKLAFYMAGALARYAISRYRASITAKGLLPWGDLVGQILITVEQSGDTHRIQAPITAVTWRWGQQPSTTIATGFAL